MLEGETRKRFLEVFRPDILEAERRKEAEAKQKKLEARNKSVQAAYTAMNPHNKVK